MTSDMSTEFISDPALVAAARFGLGVTDASVRLSQRDAHRVFHLARFDHLTGLLAAAVLAGTVVVDVADHHVLMTNWHEELLASAVLEALAARTGQHLDRAGVVWRLTKGAALAHLDYASPSWRTFGDVDLVIHPDHWAPAVQTLQSCGYVRHAEQLAGNYDRRYGKGATLTPGPGLEIDLHRRYAIGRFAVTSNMADVFESPEHVSLSGVRIPTLNAEHRLLHACYHASLGGFRRLRAFRDVAQLIMVTGADLDHTLGCARAWRAEAVVMSAITETWNRLHLDDSHQAFVQAHEFHFSQGDARALRVFQSEQPFRKKALTALPRLRPYDVPMYLWSLSSSRFPWRTRR